MIGVKIMKIKYYDDRPERGIIYDWKLIQKEYDSLQVPQGLYYPCFRALQDGTKIIQSLSMRSTGKTTNWLLVGLCIQKLYGSPIQYIRTTEEELTPTWASKLTEVIRTYENGKYILELTNGEYNDIYYHWKQFFYCVRDLETGEIVKKSDVPIIQCLAVSQEEEYKSTYNTYKSQGDFILYDEYITKVYYPNCFFHFFNLFKTIQRDRRSPVIIMCANTTNIYSPWFEEFGISRITRELKQGDSKSIVTEKGTRMYVEYIKLEQETAKKNRDEVNRLFFGFNNPKLSSITGTDDWTFDYYPHIPVETEETPVTVLVPNLYIKYSGELLRVRICTDDIRGIHARIARATKTYDDSIILSLDVEEVQNNKNYIYGLGYKNKLRKLWQKLTEEKRLYFSTNEVGTIFYEYLTKFRQNKYY